MNIAIDGPAGAGKSTVAQRVAKELGILYIDTGAMYRALTYTALVHKCSVENERQLYSLLEGMNLKLDLVNGYQHIYINDEDVTDVIRSTEVSSHVSAVAMHPSVRRTMVELQRQMARNQNVVMDGRDIGTHVLPEAELKIFLTASIEERAHRRYSELVQRGVRTDLKQLMHEIAERDRKDSEREAAPLRKAEDAVLLDTTGLDIDQVVRRIVEMYKEKAGERA
ncbi:(d)CMP kinase [Aneurinibacillus tyrosinisolvens]|uniref:(d)CMP kinase n=1 Tax=Aneurinibacillus tyrosinisolvens TaxID=1443435 RepID=UPI00063ED8F4|nr:(d)CMP kinase [Aneurinibacillus tyrosinisolvens]